MTMDYSLSSFQHFLHFQDFGQRPCTIALCLFKIFCIFGKCYKAKVCFSITLFIGKSINRIIAKGCSPTDLAVVVPLAQLGLFRMVEPLDLDHHAGAPGLPQVLYAAHIGQVRPSCRQEHGTVSHLHRVFASHDGLVEQLLGFSL